MERFGDIGLEPQEPTLPREQWTKEQRQGEAVLAGIRVVVWLTVLGSVAAAAVAFWRIFLAG